MTECNDRGGFEGRVKKNLLHILFLALACIASGGCTGAAGALRDIEPSHSLWHGSWRSTEYSLVHGSIAARIPDDITAGKETAVPVAFGSSPFSIWRPGRTYVGRCTGVLSRQGLGTATLASARQVAPEDASVLKLTNFTGAYDLVDRIWIHFNGNRTEATGFWESSDGDRGTFQMKKE